jgi:glycolate oxidase
MPIAQGSAPLELLAAQFTSLLGEHAVISDRQQLRTYECDGLAQYRVVPALVVLPESAEAVAAVVRACVAAGVPFVAPGPDCPAVRYPTRRAC